MQPGRYRHKVTIEKVETTKDAHGRYEEWEEEKQVWARVTEVSVEGQAEFEQIGYSDVSKKIEFAYPVDIELEGYRIKYNGRIYEIVKPLAEDQTGRFASIVINSIPDGDNTVS